MIDKALLDEVRSFMDRYRDAYLKLLNSLRQYTTTAGERLGKDVVRGIYSRGSKQGGQELKLPARIAEKLGRKRSEGTFRIHELNDIVGLTVTVAYHEDIERFIESLRTTLPHSINITKIEIKSARGYYAAHIDCKSNAGVQAGLIYPTKDLKRRFDQKQAIESLYREGASGDREIEDSSRGFFTLTFSEDPREIREALDLCQSALQYATEEEKDVARNYCKLYVRLGWRKLFRITQAS